MKILASVFHKTRDLVFIPTSIKCIVYAFDFDQENIICVGFAVLTSENKIARWTQHHERLIVRLFFHNTPGCDIVR